MILVAQYLLLGVHLVLNNVEGAYETKARYEPRHIAVEEPIGPWIDPQRYKIACPDYRHYALLPQYVIAPSYPDKTLVTISSVDLLVMDRYLYHTSALLSIAAPSLRRWWRR